MPSSNRHDLFGDFLAEPRKSLGGIVQYVHDRLRSRTRTHREIREKEPSQDTKALECLLCLRRFSRAEVLRGLYRLETMVCSFCYARMQKAPVSVSCFGKPTTILLNGKRELGYEKEDPECASRCPDRDVCRKVVMGNSV